MKRLAILSLAFLLIGCAERSTTVGTNEPKGVYRREIDTSKSVADGVSSQIKQGENDVYGK